MQNPIFDVKLLVLLLGDISIIIVTSVGLFDIINLIIHTSEKMDTFLLFLLC